MLFIGEKVGAAHHMSNYPFPAVDIAVDPLEGTNLCATGAPNAISVMAIAERGGLLHAPDIYMEKPLVPAAGPPPPQSPTRSMLWRIAWSGRYTISWWWSSTARATRRSSTTCGARGR